MPTQSKTVRLPPCQQWQAVQFSDAEYEATIDRYYVVDDGEIVGTKQTLYEQAVARGEQWRIEDVDIGEYEDRLTLEVPEKFRQAPLSR